MTLPLSSPIQIFCLVLWLLLFAPLVVKRLRLPALMGLIVSGMIVGPNGLGILARSGIIELLATVGLLYILFLAALEIDLNDFRRYRRKSLLFGILTFGIPFLMGLFVSRVLLGLPWHGAALLACVFSTNTPVVYPIIRKLGITRNEVVAVGLGGTIITDTVVLLVLAVLTALPLTGGVLPGWRALLSFVALFGSFASVVLGGFPYVGRWFFKYIAPDGGTQYIFIMAMLLLSAVFADAVGVEPIIGAFFAGLALNRLVPPKSVLMNRIVFIGNAIFIPFFLLGLGMVINLRHLFDSYQMAFTAAAIVVGAISAKWIATLVLQYLVKYSIAQRYILFSLTNAHAAAAAAIILIGAQMGWLDHYVVNGVVLLILCSCSLSSLLAEQYGRQLAATAPTDKPDLGLQEERVLVPISNPDTAIRLLEFARLVQYPHSHDPIFALSVTIDSRTAAQEIVQQQRVMRQAVMQLGEADDNDIRLVAKIDNNVSGGILRAVYELMATEIIIGWSSRPRATDLLFGLVSDNLVAKTDLMIIALQTQAPIHTLKRLIVIAPQYAELEKGFTRWIRTVKTLSVETDAKLYFWANQTTLDQIAYVVRQTPLHAETYYTPYEQPETELLQIAQQLTNTDMLFVVTARPQTPSYNHATERTPTDLAKYMSQHNFALVYPQQDVVVTQNSGNMYVEV